MEADMPKLKLGPIADDKPVKVTLELTASRRVRLASPTMFPGTRIVKHLVASSPLAARCASSFAAM